MKKFTLLKTMLLLCALVVGSSSVWADTTGYTPSAALSSTSGTVTGTAGETWSYSITFDNAGYYGYGAAYGWQLGAGPKDKKDRGCRGFSISTSGITGTITKIEVEAGSYNGNSKINVTVGGNNFGTQNQSTYNGQGASKSTFTGEATGEIVISATDAVRAFYLKSIYVTYSSGGGPVTYSVDYNGNGATSGTAPTDASSPYTSGATVTVLDNTGSLAKTGYSFGGWNTKADGIGTNYFPGNTFSITASTTLYAKWNFVVEDGIFDFVNVASAGVNYGSGILTTTDGNYYDTADAPVPAGTALLLKKTSGTSFDVPVAASATAPTINYLKAGPVTFTADETSRYLLKDGVFYLAGAGELAAGKAYLDLTGVSSARQLAISFDDEETTGINSVENNTVKEDGVFYNLNGQRVVTPRKGLYIVNGKKVLVK